MGDLSGGLQSSYPGCAPRGEVGVDRSADLQQPAVQQRLVCRQTSGTLPLSPGPLQLWPANPATASMQGKIMTSVLSGISEFAESPRCQSPARGLDCHLAGH